MSAIGAKGVSSISLIGSRLKNPLFKAWLEVGLSTFLSNS